MKELILLEQFILNAQATNAEHKQALGWLREVEQQLAKLIQQNKEDA
jgi:hypothetical protein